MPDLGFPELVVILIIVLLVFGGAKLPQLARSLGEAQREFRKGSDHHEADPARKDAPPPPKV